MKTPHRHLPRLGDFAINKGIRRAGKDSQPFKCLILLIAGGQSDLPSDLDLFDVLISHSCSPISWRENKHLQNDKPQGSYLCVYIYLEPKWPIFWKIWPIKWKVNPQKRGQMGSRYIHIYICLRWLIILQNHKQSWQIIVTNPPRPTPNGDLVRKSKQEMIQALETIVICRDVPTVDGWNPVPPEMYETL